MASSAEGLRDILNLKDHLSISTQPVRPSPNKQRLQHQHQQNAGHADHHEGFDEISLEVSYQNILLQPLWQYTKAFFENCTFTQGMSVSVCLHVLVQWVAWNDICLPVLHTCCRRQTDSMTGTPTFCALLRSMQGNSEISRSRYDLHYSSSTWACKGDTSYI